MKKYIYYQNIGFLKPMFCLLLFGAFILKPSSSCSQNPGSGIYGNEWLQGQYEQPWLRIGVSHKGLNRVKLPSGFQNKQTQLHLFHRGKEVSLVSATSSEIEFYGIPNDGASDVYLYRPFTGSRENSYYSWYSDESAYFLTVSENSPLKLASVQDRSVIEGSIEPFHLNEEVTVYSNDYTHDESTNAILFPLDQSFLEESKAMTGTAILKYKRPNGTVVGNPIFDFSFQLKEYVVTNLAQPFIEVLLHSRTNATHLVKTSVGKSTSNLRDLTTYTFNEFKPYKNQLGLSVSNVLSDSDIQVDGKGVLRIESLTQTDNLSTVGVSSVGYIKIVFPQKVDMSGSSMSIFNFPISNKALSRIQISGAVSEARVFDISDPTTPISLPFTFQDGILELMAQRTSGSKLKILVTTQPYLNEKVSEVTFKSINPNKFNFLIVASENLLTAAESYAMYRKTSAGGSFDPLAMGIKEVYNQFNYGEPSPIAIRRFVDFMIKDSPSNKHNLLLMGPSTSIPKTMRLNRELPGEVPTVGFPGSDILLVEGLAGFPKDVPAIPIGRISATLPEQVQNYLNKVKEFESASSMLDWKKNFLHLSGGKSTGEINSLKSQLNNLVPIVESNYLGAKVKQIVKQSFIEVEPVDISKEVNEGVGMISYLGHGSPTTTDLDYGYATDVQRGFNNSGKYPLQYFNGCGVGNIFSGRHNPSPTAGDRIPISTDWLTAKDKGSIAVIANTFYSFASTSERYLSQFYNNYFATVEGAEFSVGQIQQQVARDIMKSNVSAYDIANIHQSLLQGDPSIRLFRSSGPDYTADITQDMQIESAEDGKNIGNAEKLWIHFNLRNLGQYKRDESVPIRFSIFYEDGQTQTRDTLVGKVANILPLNLSFSRLGSISKIEVNIDFKNILSESNKNNNYIELFINWADAKDERLYPDKNLVDNLAPYTTLRKGANLVKSLDNIVIGEILTVTLNDNRELMADSSLLSVFIRPCQDGGCDFIKLNYSSDELSDMILSDKSLKLNLGTKGLSPGGYELRIEGKDLAGNSTLMPYNLMLNFIEVAENGIVNVWPNPSSQYVCFNLSDYKEVNDGFEINIYNESGHLIKKKSMNSNEDWYWYLDNIDPGLYIYQIRVINSKGSRMSGRLIVIK